MWQQEQVLPTPAPPQPPDAQNWAQATVQWWQERTAQHEEQLMGAPRVQALPWPEQRGLQRREGRARLRPGPQPPYRLLILPRTSHTRAVMGLHDSERQYRRYITGARAMRRSGHTSPIPTTACSATCML